MNNELTEVQPIKVSTLYFRASIAAEAALPAESMALIKRRDDLARSWGKAGFPDILKQTELLEAEKAIDADPLANAAMHLRALGNEAAAKES
jgi:hypothetical protein